MSTALVGETGGLKVEPHALYPSSARVPINIHPTVRNNLNDLLYQPYMRGVGFSEFIQRAIDRAYEEADEQGLEN